MFDNHRYDFDDSANGKALFSLSRSQAGGDYDFPTDFAVANGEYTFPIAWARRRVDPGFARLNASADNGVLRVTAVVEGARPIACCPSAVPAASVPAPPPSAVSSPAASAAMAWAA